MVNLIDNFYNCITSNLITHTLIGRQRQTHREIERQTDRQTDRQRDRNTERGREGERGREQPPFTLSNLSCYFIKRNKLMGWKMKGGSRSPVNPLPPPPVRLSRLQTNKADRVALNAGFTLRSSCVPQDNAEHSGHSESL